MPIRRSLGHITLNPEAHILRDVEERNLQFVQSLFAATGAGEWDMAETLVTDDFAVTEPDSLPFGGVFRGVAGLRQLYGLVMSSMGVSAIDILQMTAGGDRVVVLAEFQIEGSPQTRIALAETFRFRGGKVCEIKPYYFDHAAILKVIEARRTTHASGR